MRNYEKCAETMRKLVRDLWVEYYPDETQKAEGLASGNAHMWLRSDIVTILLDKGMDELDRIRQIIAETGLSKAEMERCGFDMNEVLREVEIREDFRSALREVEDGCELSYPLHFGFSRTDISNLAKIHKEEPLLRRKIEDLLEDCNFHTECEDFSNGNHGKYIE